MLVENQKVEVRWNPQNIKWYVGKGYTYTKTGDLFICKAEDLMPTCKVLVQVTCDYCGELFETNYGGYQKGLQKIHKSCCNKKECKDQKIGDIQRSKYIDSQFGKFVSLCGQRDYIPISQKEDYINSHSKLFYLCPKHGVKSTTLTNMENNKFGCDQCGFESSKHIHMKSVSEVKKEIERKNQNIWLNPDDFDGVNKKNLNIQCGSCGNPYTTSYTSYKNGSGKCPTCRANLSIDEVIQRVESKNNNKLLNPEEYTTYDTKNLLIRCGSCGEIFLSTLGNIDATSGKCHKCSMLLSKKEVCERIFSKNKNILLNPEDYTGYFDENLKIKCGSCGNVFITSLAILDRKTFGKCPNCSSPISWYEEYIAEFLSEHNVEFTRQEIFNGDCVDLKPLPFDFYLPSYNLCIEFDGMHHFKAVKWDKSWTDEYAEEKLKIVQYHDHIKNEYCKNNNINLLRIPYWEGKNIDTILINNLNLIA